MEKYFNFKIDWNSKTESTPLSTMEWREIKPLINHFMERNKDNTIAWVESFKSNRQLYDAVKEILDSKEIIMVRNFRYADGSGVPDPPVSEME